MPKQCEECGGKRFEFAYADHPVRRDVRFSRLVHEFCLDCGLVAKSVVEDPEDFDADAGRKRRPKNFGGYKGRSGPYGNGSYV